MWASCAAAWWALRHADQAMTRAGSIWRWASRVATRRISWTDQRTSAAAPPRLGFWGRQVVGAAPYRREQGESEHDKRDVPVPAVPAPRLVVIEPELGLGRLERILDRPARALDLHERLDAGAGRAPGGEEGEARVDDAAADEETARPGARYVGAELGRRDVGKLEVRPVVHPL